MYFALYVFIYMFISLILITTSDMSQNTVILKNSNTENISIQ